MEASAWVKPLRASSDIHGEVFSISLLFNREILYPYYAFHTSWFKITGWQGLASGTELHTLALAVRTRLLLMILRLRFFRV